MFAKKFSRDQPRPEARGCSCRLGRPQHTLGTGLFAGRTEGPFKVILRGLNAHEDVRGHVVHGFGRGDVTVVALGRGVPFPFRRRHDDELGGRELACGCVARLSKSFAQLEMGGINGGYDAITSTKSGSLALR